MAFDHCGGCLLCSPGNRNFVGSSMAGVATLATTRHRLGAAGFPWREISNYRSKFLACSTLGCGYKPRSMECSTFCCLLSHGHHGVFRNVDGTFHQCEQVFPSCNLS